MEDQLIAVIEAASALGKNKQHLFKIINRLKIDKVHEKSSDARGQKRAYITLSDYERIKENLAVENEVSNGDESYIVSGGVFYLIQLEPECDPDRFKLGFATNIEERIRSHKTAAPFSTVLKTWPCKLLWEKTAIESVTQGCRQIYTEVFSGDIEVVRRRCDEFFALMPPLDDVENG
ncbi:MAG: hypothetical protein V3571_08655 [Pseudodesulfovibrio sp.]